MNCVELQQSLADLENGGSVEHFAHLRACKACSALVRDLNQIAAAASRLQAANEPSPRIWNSIEAALRQEGVIRPQRAARRLIPSFGTRWGAAGWLIPAAAMLLMALGISLRHEPQPHQLAQQASVPVSSANPLDLNDDDLRQEIADTAPEVKTQYEENLRQVNDSIRDAQG
ncbi:MAG: anti-sigma factor, partial [Candidatus Sulfotelmatobacter sp.]